MTRLGVLGWLFCAVAMAGSQRDPNFRWLYESKQWFALREAVEHAEAPPFYRVVVSCAFGDVRGAERSFARLARSNPPQADLIEAHGQLASAHMRAGEYRRTLAHLEAMRSLDPNFAGAGGAVALFRELSHRPAPAVAHRAPAEVKMTTDFFIPLTVNGAPANYGFDTGMNLSLMSEREAARLGLEIHDVPGSEVRDGASGKATRTRVAIVKRLALGGYELRNVTFLVVAKDAMPFVELPPDRQGILGFPALYAFGGARWDRDGVFAVGFPQSANRPPNLCLPGTTYPVVAGSIGSEPIQIFFDTGAGRSLLTPRFAREFRALAESGARKESTRMRGVAGTADVEVVGLPGVSFRAGGFDFALRPAQILPESDTVDRSSYHVWLGMDVLGQARRVTLDFRSMTFTAE